MNEPHDEPAGAASHASTTAAEGSPTAGAGAAPVGPVATLLLGLAILVGYLVLQSLLVAVFALVGASPGELTAEVVTARVQERAGLLFALATFVAAPIAVAACCGLTWLWASGPRVRDRQAAAVVRRHLGLVRPPVRATLLWLAGTGGFMVLYETASRLLQRPPLPDFMVELHATAGSMWWLGAAVVVAAPAVEETLFRGFLLPGLAASRLGGAGAVVLTALLWAAIHLQYDLFDMSAIVVLGLLFGAARLRTRSLWTPFVLHMAVNLAAMVQLVWSLGWGPG